MKYIKLFEDFVNEQDSYNDYPSAAKKNAQLAIDWKENTEEKRSMLALQ